MQGLVARGLTLEEIWKGDVKGRRKLCQSLQPKYMSRSPGQAICRVSTLRSTLQGLMVVGLIVEEIERRHKMCQSLERKI